MSLTPFRLVLAPNGAGTIEVNGVDLSGVVAGLSLIARPGAPCRLTVEVFGTGEIEGVGEVAVIRQGAELAELLANIDPEELEKEALSRLEGFDQSATQAMLDVLREWVSPR